jgi:imidazole glycerol-phosphate synthase subunit HisH
MNTNKCIGIVNYGMGNIHSLKNAVKSLGYGCVEIEDPQELRNVSHLILPGVGAFGPAIDQLKKMDLMDSIKQHVTNGKPLLGICLGMQLLFETSEESLNSLGLGLLKGNLKHFEQLNDSGFIPQIQWNTVSKAKESYLFKGITEQHYFFCHSFFLNDCLDEVVVGKSKYLQTDYVSIVEQNNITGVQFHPEKSGTNGLNLLKNFIESI